MKLKFLGSTASIPDLGEDSPCFLVNNAYLFDCGWAATGALRETGCDLSKIRYILFTHMHHDHYMGLAGLLFYFIHSRKVDLNDLTILGPADDLERVLENTYRFLELDRYYPTVGRPKAVPLGVGECLETPDAIIRCGACRHPVDARCYSLTDKHDGTVLAASGDTAYTPEMIPLFTGAQVLIHDATRGDNPKTETCNHSTLFEAVKMAEEAHIPALFPVHMSRERAKESKTTVQPTTSVRIICPEKGKEYIFDKEHTL